MSAIIALCHFCDAHGPRPIFSTYASEEKIENNTIQKQYASCKACSSIDSNVYISKSEQQSANYYSSEFICNNEVMNLLRNCAVRSLTCEINWTKEGGVVYFSVGDDNHILSLTFQIKDSQARGLKRWFSFIVLMKDKILLLSLMPFLSQHLQDIVVRLQTAANKIYEEDQKICSQRALRINSGTSDFGPLRSLPELTDDENIFKKLHTSLCWLLRAASGTYMETLYTSNELLSTWYNNNNQSLLMEVNNAENSVRRVKNIINNDDGFRKILYCTLCGIDIFLRLKSSELECIADTLKRITPTLDIKNVKHIKICKSFEEEVATAASCILEEQDPGKLNCKWPGILPDKCPLLMIRIESAVANSKMIDSVLAQQISALKLECINIMQTLKMALVSSSANSQSITQLKKSLGISPQDELLLNYWIQYL